MRVAISQRLDLLSDRQEWRESLDPRLVDFLLALGCSPYPISNTLSTNLPSYLRSLAPSAIVLSGGNDIGEHRKRDETEKQLLTYAKSHRLPVLGICRGMQMLATLEGSVLSPLSGHVALFHKVEGSIQKTVNSFHQYVLMDCPEDYEVLALAEDSSIEAIRHTQLPWEGWMWHPERLPSFDPEDLHRAKTLFGVKK
jgi:gamma-glutamyl-gamma-aminobutyrate hydrolase PuuD